MQYLAWRVLAGLNSRIEISFMMVGHTKFAPDWAFGLLKQRFKRTEVGCLDDLVKVVNDSASVNHAQLVGRENGEVVVKQYDWAAFFAAYFRRSAFEGIKSFHHLVFTSSNPGQVLVRTESDGEVTVLKVLSKAHLQWKPSPDTLPQVITPPGLPRERQMYLREFVPEDKRDIVCPNPDATPTFAASMSTPSGTPGESSTPPTLSSHHSPSPSPQPKRRRRRHH